MRCIPPIGAQSRLVLAVRLLAALALVAWGWGCSGDGGAETDAKAGAKVEAGLAELVAAGLDRKVGKAKVAKESSDAGVTTVELDPASGPVCMRGDPFRFSMRDGGADDLLIFLQGGGACWSDFCLAVTKAPAGIPKLDALDPARTDNPWAASDVVYLPYCDGSMFAGDVELDEDGDGKPDRFQHGLANLTSALEAARTRWPAPSRITLAGSSGGAYGTFSALPLVRLLWPDVAIDVVEDSGPGLGKPGDPALVTRLLTEFGALSLVPGSCTDCLASGHLLTLRRWQLQHLPNVRIASVSALHDGILAGVFLSVSGAAYEAALRAETDAMAADFPNRYRRFFVHGRHHTALLGTPAGIIGDDLGAVEMPKDALGKLAGIVFGSLATTALDGQPLAHWLAALHAAPTAAPGAIEAVIAADSGWRDIVPGRGGADGKGYPQPPPATIGPASRPARLILPKDDDAVLPLPVVVLLGGYDSTAQDFEDWIQLGKAVNGSRFALILADGVVDSAGSPTWNATDTCCDHDGVGTDDVGYLLGLLEHAGQVANLDPRRVVLVGHSAGGFMAYRLACDHPERIAAVVSIAGSGFLDAAKCQATQPVSVLQIHGLDDDVMPYDGDAEAPGAREVVRRWAVRAGCDEAGLVKDDDGLELILGAIDHETTVEHYGKGCAPGIDVRLWTMKGVDHDPDVGPTFRPTTLGWALAKTRPWPGLPGAGK